MINQSNEWVFVKKPSRRPLNTEEVSYWSRQFKTLLKAGIEIELNLPDKNGTCDRQNYLCPCVATFKAPDPISAENSNCFEQCTNWQGGSCEVAKAEGCAGVHCVHFQSPCPRCDKYDRGCTSCPELYSISKEPRYIRQSMEKVLKPTHFVGQHGATGTYKVCRDGSLLGDGGVEVATVGRRVQFQPIYQMVKNIVEEAKKHGAYTSERCSIHVHLLASYLKPEFAPGDLGGNYLQGEITELERPIPEIIVANFHQLLRRYHCALIWMSAAGESKKRLTRWEKFRKSILPYSAIKYKMPIVTKEIGSANGTKRKYSMMNYEQMRFNDIGDAERLHVEGRYMDGSLSPAVITAQTCLLFGLMIKAVEISRHGVLKSGSRAYMDLQKEMYQKLCNNDGGWDSERFSDTSALDPYTATLKNQSLQLVRLIRNTLGELAPADQILQSLAERPVALRLIAGDSWDKIEKDLMPNTEQSGPVEDAVNKLINLGAISECINPEEWVAAATVQVAGDSGVGSDPEKTNNLQNSISSYVSKLTEENRVNWSQEVGGFLAS